MLKYFCDECMSEIKGEAKRFDGRGNSADLVFFTECCSWTCLARALAKLVGKIVARKE